MKRDFHFDVVRLLGAWAGLDSEQSTLVAWASEKTDRITKPPAGGIQTQVPIEAGGNWSDRQVQLTVEAAFHFVPGDGDDWMVTPNSTRAQTIVQAALDSGDPIRLGIALHALADTWSHQNFSGFIDKRNACYPWSNLLATMLPNLGHADMLEAPDMIEATWTDPRTGEKIVNRERFLVAATRLYGQVRKFAVARGSKLNARLVAYNLADIFKIKKYDERRDVLFVTWHDLGCKGYKSYRDNIDPELTVKHGADFDKAAKAHLAFALTTFKDLPVIKQ